MTTPDRTAWQRFARPKTFHGYALGTLFTAIVMLPIGWLLLGTLREALAVIVIASLLSLLARAVRTQRLPR